MQYIGKSKNKEAAIFQGCVWSWVIGTWDDMCGTQDGETWPAKTV